MRLSEAILLGSMQIKHVPFTTNDWKGGGCALGMGLAAIGKYGMFAAQPSTSWPWLLGDSSAPCGCKEVILPNLLGTCSSIISTTRSPTSSTSMSAAIRLGL